MQLDLVQYFVDMGAETLHDSKNLDESDLQGTNLPILKRIAGFY